MRILVKERKRLGRQYNRRGQLRPIRHSGIHHFGEQHLPPAAGFATLMHSVTRL